MLIQVKAKAIAASKLVLTAGLLVLAVACYSRASATQIGESPQPRVYSETPIFVWSYDNARVIWPFPLKEPTYLPEGMELGRIFLSGLGPTVQRGSPEEATILSGIKTGKRPQGYISSAYNRPGDAGNEVLQIWQGFGPGWIDMTGVPREAQGTVTLEDGKLATWKKGVTYLRGNVMNPANLEWVPRDQVYLFWTVDGQWGYGHLGYMITSTGDVTLEEVVKVANSLR